MISKKNPGAVAAPNGNSLSVATLKVVVREVHDPEEQILRFEVVRAA